MNRRYRYQSFFVGLILAIFLVSCAQEESPAKRAEEIANAYLLESGLPGIAVTVAVNDQIIWSHGFGYADLEQHVPVIPAKTRFRVGSTAKSMTAMAVGQLYEAGKLDLDAPIQVYLPDYPVKEGVVTARLLAGHLAGIRHYQGDEFLSARAYSSVYEALDIFKNDPLLFLPGTDYSYSTYGYNLLSAVIEAAAGEDFLSYMAQHVFGPIGMTRTVADQVLPIISDRSRYYEIGDGEVTNSAWVDNSNKWAGGGILSTSEDLAKFASAHLSNRFLKAATIKMMWTSQVTASGEQTGYGIGWSMRTDDLGRQVIQHNGGSVGGTTNMRIYPDDALVIAVITNTSGAAIGSLTDALVETFLDNQ